MRRFVASLLAAVVLVPAGAQVAAAETPPTTAVAPADPASADPAAGVATPADAGAVGGCVTAALRAWFDAEFAWIDAELVRLASRLEAETAARVTAIQVRSTFGGRYLTELSRLELWDQLMAWHTAYRPSPHPTLFLGETRATILARVVAADLALVAEMVKVAVVEKRIAALQRDREALELYRTALEQLRAALGAGIALGGAVAGVVGAAVCPLFVPPARPEVEPEP